MRFIRNLDLACIRTNHQSHYLTYQRFDTGDETMIIKTISKKLLKYKTIDKAQQGACTIDQHGWEEEEIRGKGTYNNQTQRKQDKEEQIYLPL